MPPRKFTFFKKLELVAFIAGFITLTFELTAARIVAPYLGATIYTWTSIIGVILAALAVGYVIGGVLADKRKQAHIGIRFVPKDKPKKTQA